VKWYVKVDKYPEKLAELQKIFYQEAEKYNVLPIDNDKVSTAEAPLHFDGSSRSGGWGIFQ